MVFKCFPGAPIRLMNGNLDRGASLKTPPLTEPRDPLREYSGPPPLSWLECEQRESDSSVPLPMPPVVTNELGAVIVYVDHGRPSPFEDWFYYSGARKFTVRFGGSTRESMENWLVVQKREQEIKDVPNNGVEPNDAGAP